MSMTSTTLRSRTLAVLMAGAGLAHLPVAPMHLREAPYMGGLFLAFAATGVVLGALLWWRPGRWPVDIAGMLCVAAVLTYAATRLVAFPQIGDDVGNWGEPWGVVSIVLESSVVVLAAVSRRAAAVASPPARVGLAADGGVRQRVAA